MSREEAATVYLDVLLGYRGEYRRFNEAVEALTENDKLLLQNAVFRYPCKEAGIKKPTMGRYF
jgi:hypothetical protein